VGYSIRPLPNELHFLTHAAPAQNQLPERRAPRVFEREQLLLPLVQRCPQHYSASGVRPATTAASVTPSSVVSSILAEGLAVTLCPDQRLVSARRARIKGESMGRGRVGDDL
jgi:hypothetical protein